MYPVRFSSSDSDDPIDHYDFVMESHYPFGLNECEGTGTEPQALIPQR